MKKKILILGSAGMLGIEVLREFSKNNNFELTSTYRTRKDLTLIKKVLSQDISNVFWKKFIIKGDYEKNLKKIVKNKDYIINCIGVIKPYINEESLLSVKNAIEVNSIFPHCLKKNIDKKTKVLQIATDCVFDGKKGNYYENSSHNAKDIYGKTKSLGEVNSKNFFNIRCSIIGKEIKNYKSLVDWFLSSKKGITLNGFTNHLWNGVSTRYFARCLKIIISKNIQIPNLIHLVPSNTISKYELLKIFIEKFNRIDLKINKTKSGASVNRVLKSKNKKLIVKINKKLGFKKIPSVKEIVCGML